MFLSGKDDRRNGALLDKARSALLVIDIQEKFLGAVKGMEEAGRRASILVRAAARLGIPVVGSEQYPKALGSTLPGIASVFPPGTPVYPKVSFSACDNPPWSEAVHGLRRNQLVLCGVEAHVCVLGTALDLIQNSGAQVYVVEDAVASRFDSDKDAALRRMESHGAQRVTLEMVVFEWLRQAGTPEFKELQALLK